MKKIDAGFNMAFILEGSRTSYAQFRQWDGSSGENSTMELEFRTSKTDSLLLYTDNREAREYMLLKLVSGGASGVSLRFNWGNGPQVRE